MSFGGKGSSYEWQKGMTSRDAPRRLEMPYDQLVRGLIGQMAEPPETAISTPLQQAMSNLQSGDPSRAFGLGGGFGDRIARQSMGSSGTGAAGFTPGSFLPGAEGGQQGLQSREQLGLPDRESYFPFSPTADEIQAIGIPPVRTGIKKKKESEKQIGKLEERIAERGAAGKGHAKADRRLERVKERLARETDPSPRRGVQ